MARVPVCHTSTKKTLQSYLLLQVQKMQPWLSLNLISKKAALELSFLCLAHFSPPGIYTPQIFPEGFSSFCSTYLTNQIGKNDTRVSFLLVVHYSILALVI